jgi:CheY-like chemotaxis protein
MKEETTIILAEDDEGHASLIIKILRQTGITNDILHFTDGQETLDFLFGKGEGPHMERGINYLLLLDINMPRVNGIEVLRQIKHDELRKMPVIMITTTDDPNEIELCYEYGCSNYIVKPVSYDKFNDAFKHLGEFLHTVVFP